MSEHGVTGMEPGDTGVRWMCVCWRSGKGSRTYIAAMAAFIRHLKSAQGGDE